MLMLLLSILAVMTNVAAMREVRNVSSILKVRSTVPTTVACADRQHQTCFRIVANIEGRSERPVPVSWPSSWTKISSDPTTIAFTGAGTTCQGFQINGLPASSSAPMFVSNSTPARSVIQFNCKEYVKRGEQVFMELIVVIGDRGQNDRYFGKVTFPDAALR